MSNSTKECYHCTNTATEKVLDHWEYYDRGIERWEYYCNECYKELELDWRNQSDHDFYLAGE